MTPPRLKIFLDTSVVFAAVLSSTGGARKLLLLGEVGMLKLVVGPAVLREVEGVVRRKSPDSLPLVAQLLDLGQVIVAQPADPAHVGLARTYVAYPPDARVFAEALQAGVDWFITHDKKHFLNVEEMASLPLRVGTPGDVLQYIKGMFE